MASLAAACEWKMCKQHAPALSYYKTPHFLVLPETGWMSAVMNRRKWLFTMDFVSAVEFIVQIWPIFVANDYKCVCWRTLITSILKWMWLIETVFLSHNASKQINLRHFQWKTMERNLNAIFPWRLDYGDMEVLLQPSVRRHWVWFI